MGFAIKRQDGTYRAWNANAKDDHLLPGEVWDELPSIPTITVPPSPPSALAQALDAVLADPVPSPTKLKAYLQEVRKQTT